MNDRSWRIWVARLLIGVVTFWNLLAAIQFLTRPAAYAPGFELEGAAGSAMIQGMGLQFVMWNIPYLIALLNPVRNRLSLTEAVIMQIIGAAGETLLLSSLQGDHLAIRSTVTRFILFDSIGVLLLVAAWGILRKRIPGQE
jgi:hypothetical protein